MKTFFIVGTALILAGFASVFCSKKQKNKDFQSRYYDDYHLHD